jgi:hypothetical protein
MIKNFAASAFVALVLGGCSAIQLEEKLPPPAADQGVELTKEQGGRFIAFVGPKLQHTEPFLGVSDTNYFALRSWLDNKTNETAHQLYVEDSYDGGPYNWNGVHDASNQSLKFIPISRNQITCDKGCSYADEFAAALPEDYLRAHQDGFAATFTAADGKALAVNVPANLVAAELGAIDAVRAKIATATANPAAPPAGTAAPTSAGAPPAPVSSATPPTAALAPGAIVPAPPATTTPPTANGR